MYDCQVVDQILDGCIADEPNSAPPTVTMIRLSANHPTLTRDSYPTHYQPVPDRSDL